MEAFILKQSYWAVVILILMLFSYGASQTQRWLYRYDGPGNGVDEDLSLVYGSDGNIYTAGYSVGTGSSYDFTVISLTATGIQRWVYRYIGPIYGGANSLIYGEDGNIYAAGYSNGNGPNRDLIVISLTSTGTQRWVYRYNGPGNSYDEANTLVYGADSNLYIAGASYGSSTDLDFVVISLSSTGTELWVYRYNGPANSYDEATALVYGADSNIYVSGGSIGSGTDYDFTVISLSSAGTERWVYRYNGPGNSGDGAFSICYGADSNIYVAGTSTGSGTGGDFTVVSILSTGQGRWIYRYNGPANDYDAAFSIVYGTDGNIYAAGASMDIGVYNTDITVISLNPAVGIEERTAVSSPQFAFRCFGSRIEFSVTLSKPTNIPFSIYNITGKKVLAFNIFASQGTSHHQKDLSFLPTGVYVVKAEIEGKNVNNKFIVVK